MTVKTDAFSYDRDQIEELLPGLWDPEYAYGTRTSDGDVEPGMPKAKRHDPRTADDWIAHMCDMQIAWANCKSISPNERVALFLRYGMHWDQQFIAEHEGITARAVAYRIDSGINTLIAFLDGRAA